MTALPVEKTGNIADIINIINRSKEVFNYEIYVPSLKRTVNFREMNTSQQKRIIKTIVDSSAYNTEFIFAMREIIKENCVDTTVSVDDLTIVDKLLIAVNMRMVSIGNDLKLMIKSSKGNEQEYTVHLSDIVNSFPEIPTDSELIEDVDGNSTFRLVFGLPTISEEYNLESELRTNSKGVVASDEDVKSTIGNIFSSELSKYIKVLFVKNAEGEEIEVNLRELSFKNRIKIIESLPTKIVNKVLKRISEINKKVEEVFIVKAVIDGEDISQRLRLNASFFMDS